KFLLAQSVTAGSLSSSLRAHARVGAYCHRTSLVLGFRADSLSAIEGLSVHARCGRERCKENPGRHFWPEPPRGPFSRCRASVSSQRPRRGSRLWASDTATAGVIGVSTY